ncbi:MAG: carboxypeptidase regulatory-like domain-containing protein, partial [Elusimicrobia bacterium]|nr:carboxypeptidase regulatory-like domain-containing protein [Elusimicrobiota bacterium]
MAAFLLAGRSHVSPVVAATLVVTVANDRGDPLAGVDVAAVAFDPATQVPSALLTELGQTTTNGQVSFSVNNNTPYTIFATAPGYTPTAQTQLSDPENVSLQGEGTLTKQIILIPGMRQVGQLQTSVKLSTASGLIIASVELRKTRTPVASGVQRLTSQEGLLTLSNVPPAPAGAYRLTAFEVLSGRALSVVVPEEILVGRTLAVGTLDFSNSGAVAAPTQGSLNVGGMPAVEGVVKESLGGRPVVEAKVLIIDLNDSRKPPRVSVTDANGRYEVFDLPPSTYALLALANGYDGVLDNGGGNGYAINGDRLVRHFDGSSAHNAALAPARGTVAGVVRWGGQPLPGVEVVAVGDPRVWQGTDRYAGSVAARGEGRQRTAADGTFTLSGLAPGNYVIQVIASWLAQPYVWNWGSNQWLERAVGGVAAGDDQRLSVAKINDTTWANSLYNAAGTALPSSLTINLADSGSVSAPTGTGQVGQVTGTLQFPTVVTLSQDRPIMILARQVANVSGDQAAVGTAVIPAQGTVTGQTFPYSLNVQPGGLYVLEVQSAEYGMVRQPGVARRVDLTRASVVTNVDLALAPAGRVVGFIKLPDGSLFRPINGGTVNDRLCQVEAQGDTVASWAVAEVGETGHFELRGLLPGRYTLRTMGSGEFPWSNATLREVAVTAGQTAQIEISLAPGVPCRPTVPAAALRLWPGARGGFTVVAVPAGQAFSASKWRGLLLGFDAAAEFFQVDTTTWTVGYLAPGQYDFYVRYLEEYGQAEDGISSRYPFSVLLGAAKNVFIGAESQKTGSPPAVTVSIPAVPLIVSGVQGQVTGRSPFSAGDLKLYGQEIFTLLSRAPIIAVLGPSGELKALAQAVPPNQSSVLGAWQTAAASGDPVRIQTLMARFPLAYRVLGLPTGTYTGTLLSPSLPPVTTRLQVSGLTTWDISLDRDAPAGGRIEGRVTDAVSGRPLGEAWVALKKSRMVERTARSDAAGRYTFEGLPRGVYTLTVTKPGYALGGAKQSIPGVGGGVEGRSVVVETRLVPATGSFTGKVLLQALPFPLAVSGVRVVAYDDTQNGQDPTGFLPLYTAVTDAYGRYTLEGVQENHTYKIAALAPGRAVAPLTKMGSKDQISGVDLFLRAAAPPVTIRAQPQNSRLMISVTTLRPLKTAPLIETPTGTLSTIVAGENSWNALLAQFQVGQDISLRVTLDDGGASPYAVSGMVNSEELVRTQLSLVQEVVMGGTIEVNPDGNDFSGIEIQAGGLTEVAATAAERALRQPLGGALETRPQLRITKISRQQTPALRSLPRERVASDAVQIDLTNAQLNRPLTLTLNYDQGNVADPNPLTIGQYHAATKTWRLVPGVVTVDPFMGTASIELPSVTYAATSAEEQGTLRTAGMSLFTGKEFRPRPDSPATHNGLFAVFQGVPPTTIGYVGTAFNVYNFPNPFSLQSKTLSL